LQCGRWPWRIIETFAKFLGRAPDTVTGDDIRRFQAEQITQGTQPPKMNTQASALLRAALLHVAPKGQHRVRHYGPFANGTRVDSIALARKLLGVTAAEIANDATKPMHDQGPPTKSWPQPSPSLTRRPVRAAAAKCASSKSSSAARRPGTKPRRARQRPGSIHHDDGRRSAAI
jgi:hypothetical protein